MDHGPGVVVFDDPNMRKTTVTVLHMFETSLDIVFPVAPCFKALVGHPVFIFRHPAGTVSDTSPENEFDRSVVKANHNIRVLVHRPEIVPSIVVFQFRVKGAETARVLFDRGQPSRRNVRGIYSAALQNALLI